MPNTISDNLGSGTVVATITLSGLASSATAGRQSTPVSLLDGNNDVPIAVDLDVSLTLGTGTLGGDRAVYLWVARSVDGINFESGPPTTGPADAAFTFASSPVGSSPLPTDLYYLGAIPFNLGSGESRRKVFRIAAPTANFALVVLNYSGITLSAGSVQYRKRFGDSR